MKPIFKLLLTLSLISTTIAWSDEKPEEDFCDAEWDGKVEYKAEGEKDEPTPTEEEKKEEPETTPAEEGKEDKDKEKEPKSEEDTTEPAAGEGTEPATGDGEQPEKGETDGGKAEGKEDQPGEKTPEGGSKEDERSDPSNTYHKSAELVHDAANVDDLNIQDEYLKGSLNNRLQEHIRNPIIGTAGKLPNFKKIEPCFKTMKQDLKKEIDASKKEFEDCKKKTDSSYDCMVKMEPGFAVHVKAIGEMFVQCMEKSKKITK